MVMYGSSYFYLLFSLLANCIAQLETHWHSATRPFHPNTTIQHFNLMYYDALSRNSLAKKKTVKVMLISLQQTKQHQLIVSYLCELYEARLDRIIVGNNHIFIQNRSFIPVYFVILNNYHIKPQDRLIFSLPFCTYQLLVHKYIYGGDQRRGRQNLVEYLWHKILLTRGKLPQTITNEHKKEVPRSNFNSLAT